MEQDLSERVGVMAKISKQIGRFMDSSKENAKFEPIPTPERIAFDYVVGLLRVNYEKIRGLYKR